MLFDSLDLVIAREPEADVLLRQGGDHWRPIDSGLNAGEAGAVGLNMGVLVPGHLSNGI